MAIQLQSATLGARANTPQTPLTSVHFYAAFDHV